MLLDFRTKIFSRINIILKIWVTASIPFIYPLSALLFLRMR